MILYFYHLSHENYARWKFVWYICQRNSAIFQLGLFVHFKLHPGTSIAQLLRDNNNDNDNDLL